MTREEWIAKLLAALPPIFAECVTKNELKYKLDSPFVQGEHVYATDGRIMARVAATDALERLAAPMIEGGAAHPLIPVEWFDPGLYPIGPVAAPEPPQLMGCYFCHGVKRIPMRDEDWQIWDEDGTCNMCGGLHVLDWEKVRIPVSDLQGIGYPFARILHKHGATLFVRNDGVIADRVPAVRFTLPDGVEGCLMTLRPEEPREMPRAGVTGGAK